MSIENSLSLHPFNLSKEGIAWVTKTRDALSTDDKLRQLFIHISIGENPEELANYAKFRSGGLHRFMGPDLKAAWQATHDYMASCEIPPFISGDIEGGGHGSSSMLQFPNNLGLSAANDTALSEELLTAVCAESLALGFNWSFTPCIDINANPQSAIVGTRSYGSDLKRIAAQSKTHIATLQKHGIAATAKHWPGEGYDQRDQHLVTTVNPLSMEQWHDGFGALYRSLIEQGVLSVMSAHIALPAYMEQQNVPEGLERLRPASIAKHLNLGLLRKDLGFNGLIVSDATPMGGLTSWSARAAHVPEVIENGCDVFLFSPNPEADLKFMTDGLLDGRLSEQRLEDAVTRILALKAKLGLHRKTLNERIKPFAEVQDIVKSKSHLAVAKKAAEKSITLVKDVKSYLPLSPTKFKRVTLIDRGAPNLFGGPRSKMAVFQNELESRGFEISPFNPATPPSPENCDLLVYVMATESSLTLSHIHIDWPAEHQSFLASMDRYWHDVPTLMISFGHAHHLRDAPRVPAYVNAYSTTEVCQRACAAAMCGDIEFKGTSPVDAFAGAPDARF